MTTTEKAIRLVIWLRWIFGILSFALLFWIVLV